jgi:predicted Zn-dependent protease
MTVNPYCVKSVYEIVTQIVRAKNKLNNIGERKMRNLKNMLAKPVIALLVGLFIVIVPACDDNGNFNPLDFNAFAPSDDVALGQSIDSQIVADPQQYPIYNNAEATAYVQGIVNQILQSPEIQYRDVFNYKVRLIADNNTVNAFSVPGGSIYVYTGILKFLDDEASLAGVLAHEIAHAEKRHATLRITHQYGIEFMLSLLLGNNPGQLEQIAASIAENLTLLKNSRSDETEADDMSFKYLQSTQWYPGAIMYFFQKVMQNETGGFLQELLSTHPLSQDRLADIQAKVDAAHLPAPSESNLFRARYQQFKSTLP